MSGSFDQYICADRKKNQAKNKKTESNWVYGLFLLVMPGMKTKLLSLNKETRTYIWGYLLVRMGWALHKEAGRNI